MRGMLFAGLLALGLGSAACEVEQETALAPAPGADMGELQALENEQRPQYEAMAEDMGVDTWPEEVRVELGEETGQGGSGQAGQGQPKAQLAQEWKGCAQALAAPEPTTVVTGQVQQVSKDLLAVEDAGGRRVDLHADAQTCLLWNNQPLQPSQLKEGTAVRVAYVVDPEEGVTARVVRIIQQQRPAP